MYFRRLINKIKTCAEERKKDDDFIHPVPVSPID